MGRKTTVWIFQATNWRYRTQDDMDMAKKKKSKKETEFQLIAVQNNNIWNNYVLAKIRRIASVGYVGKKFK